MKKNILLVLFGLIAGSTLTATAAYVYTASDIGYQPQDSTWSVTNASEALSSLKEDLNNVNTNVTEYKQQITEALADKGVSVDETSTMSDITSGITNMGSTDVYYLGQGTSFDVKTKLPDKYASLTNDNFIVGFVNTTASSSFNGDTWKSASGSTSFAPTVNYDSETGTLTITNLSGSWRMSGTDGSGSGSASTTVEAYAVIGTIN